MPPRTTAPPPGEPGGGAVLIRRSERGDVRRLRALLALLDVERDPLAFVERAVPAGLDGRVVDEDVRSSTVGGGEAEPLLSVEPLHCSFGHCSLLAEVVHRGPAIAQGLPDAPSLATHTRRGTAHRPSDLRVRPRGTASEGVLADVETDDPAAEGVPPRPGAVGHDLPDV